MALPASAASTIVLHYSGAETSGAVATDTSPNHNDGTLHQVALNGQAYSFNGSSYIETPASTTVNPDTADFSYSVSINIPTTVTFSHDLSLVRRASSKFAGAYYKMEMVYKKSTGHMRLECAFRDSTGARGFVTTSANTLNDGLWHTLTCSKTATSVSLTKDGRVHTTPATLGDLSSTEPLDFGAEQIGPTSYWEKFTGLMNNITLTKG